MEASAAALRKARAAAVSDAVSLVIGWFLQKRVASSPRCNTETNEWKLMATSHQQKAAWRVDHEPGMKANCAAPRGSVGSDRFALRALASDLLITGGRNEDLPPANFAGCE